MNMCTLGPPLVQPNNWRTSSQYWSPEAKERVSGTSVFLSCNADVSGKTTMMKTNVPTLRNCPLPNPHHFSSAGPPLHFKIPMASISSQTRDHKLNLLISCADSSAVRRVASQFFLVSPRDHFVCPAPSFFEMKEIGWRKVLGFQKTDW